MAAQHRIDLTAHYDRVADLLTELGAIAVHVREAQARESHPHFPRPVAWPAEPTEVEWAVAKMYDDGGGRVSQYALCPALEKLYPEKTWNQSAVRNCLRRVARWRAMNKLAELMSSGMV